ncbi:hypothetical protein Y1Q_0012466 [Alligator mississippiensis]|uniref:Uncharacterized protein n=1 Tax=Alligator mississippiensis TaxID=8496 RepID=A0A151M7Q7_ALLMI|nr:hypothetical protein Y1Q_0012466 [Alligator mississippiensis]
MLSEKNSLAMHAKMLDDITKCQSVCIPPFLVSLKETIHLKTYLLHSSVKGVPFCSTTSFLAKNSTENKSCPALTGKKVQALLLTTRYPDILQARPHPSSVLENSTSYKEDHG